MFIKNVVKFLLGLTIFAVISLLYALFSSPGGFKMGGMQTSTFDLSKWSIVQFSLFSIQFGLVVFLVILYFGFARKSLENEVPEETHKKIEVFEKKYFWIAISILLVMLLLTVAIPLTTNQLAQARDNRTRISSSDTLIYAHAFQFGFEFKTNGTGSVTNNTWMPTLTLIKDKLYEFVLFTSDTTHGFGVYSPQNLLVDQSQIVPGYNTHFLMKFTETGVYTIRCMEYCGAGHQIMETTITVA